MEGIMKIGKGLFSRKKQCDERSTSSLRSAQIGRTYMIKAIDTRDQEMKNFLFTLGCYEGEMVTVISKLAENYVISVKDARYSIDQDLAEAIII